MVDPISLEIFKNLFSSVADEMGVSLGRTAYSPNIKERRDYSCALFDGEARLIAQAAHIPVHLGAMPLSVEAAIVECAPVPGDVVILNDPFLGGTHLPDITTVSCAEIADRDGRPFRFYSAIRAHHADVGGMSPGSMPMSTELYQEGIIIPPIKLVHDGGIDEQIMRLICRNVRTPEERRWDLGAQIAAHRVGERRMVEIVHRYGTETVVEHVVALIDYAARLTTATIDSIPDGRYRFADRMDGDGQSETPITIVATVTIDGGRAVVDFDGTDPEVAGSVNAVLAVTRSAAYYVFRCLTGDRVPTNGGCFTPIEVRAPAGSVVNARPPRAVAGGNVETAQRITDVVFGALAQAIPGRIPAASQGTMNNVTFGGWDNARMRPFAYYETIGGGIGGGPTGPGASGLHSHMTNTLNTPVEAMESEMPVRIRAYRLRRGSGGAGAHRGGDGIVREYEFAEPATVTLLSDRRLTAPYGVAGGKPGMPGLNTLIREDGSTLNLGGKTTIRVQPGEIVRIETPGGGGWGAGS